MPRVRIQLTRLLLAAFCVIAAITLAGCGSSGPQKVVMVLIDRQTVAPGGTFLPQYQADYQRVVNRLADQGGLLFVDVVDGDPLSEASQVIRADFPTYDDLEGNQTEHTHKIAEAKALALDGVASALGQPPTTPGLDLLSGMRLAERVFANYPNRKKSLVVFASMFQQTADVDFLFGDPAAYEELLVARAVPGSLPNLHDVAVYVAAAGVAPQGGADVDAARVLAVQNFWTAWMKAAGTEIQPGHYGLQLVAIP